MGIRVGIDLGTTFSAIARINESNGKPEIIRNSFGDPITPSVLCFESNGNILFGEDAKNMQATGDTNTIAFFKRNMGNDLFLVDFFGKSYNATDLSAIFLSKLKQEAENEIGEKIDDAVITVPAYFTHKERQATIDAGKKAGLNVLAIINEPTAAALAYGLNGKDEEQTVLIYDLGGGTFDVTIARISKIEVDIIGSDGNHELGGKDWDDCIARYLAQEFLEKYSIDISEDSEMVVSLVVTAESVKKQLTSMDEVKVPLTYKNVKGNVTITEELFEEISGFLIGATKEVTENLIESVGLAWKDITGTILVGGSTRMRMVCNYVKEMSGKEPLSGVNVDEAVALGAAIRANIDEKGNTVSSSFFGTLLSNKSSTFAIDGRKAVSDVTAHALGMISLNQEGDKYINSVIIKKNTKIPAVNTRSFNYRSKARGNELEVYVLQGAFERPLDNTIINKYVITKIEKTSQNPTVIDVQYKYTSNGMVVVTAMQKDTGKTLPIRIEPVPEDMSWSDEPPHVSTVIPSVEIILAIDLSGSMSGIPVEKAKNAMEDFVKQMNPDNAKIGVMAFADSAKLIIDPTYDFARVIKVIDDLEVGDVGICNGAEPFSLSLSKLQHKFLKRTSDVKYIIVLTDGIWSYPGEAIKEAKKCHNEGIEVMALGFGGADYDFLKQIASTDDFASLTNLSELSGSFSKIAQAIGENSSGGALKVL